MTSQLHTVETVDIPALRAKSMANFDRVFEDNMLWLLEILPAVLDQVPASRAYELPKTPAHFKTPRAGTATAMRKRPYMVLDSNDENTSPMALAPSAPPPIAPTILKEQPINTAAPLTEVKAKKVTVLDAVTAVPSASMTPPPPPPPPPFSDLAGSPADSTATAPAESNAAVAAPATTTPPKSAPGLETPSTILRRGTAVTSTATTPHASKDAGKVASAIKHFNTFSILKKTAAVRLQSVPEPTPLASNASPPKLALTADKTAEPAALATVPTTVPTTTVSAVSAPAAAIKSASSKLPPTRLQFKPKDASAPALGPGLGSALAKGKIGDSPSVAALKSKFSRDDVPAKGVVKGSFRQAPPPAPRFAASGSAPAAVERLAEAVEDDVVDAAVPAEMAQSHVNTDAENTNAVAPSAPMAAWAPAAFVAADACESDGQAPKRVKLSPEPAAAAATKSSSFSSVGCDQDVFFSPVAAQTAAQVISDEHALKRFKSSPDVFLPTVASQSPLLARKFPSSPLVHSASTAVPVRAATAPAAAPEIVSVPATSTTTSAKAPAFFNLLVGGSLMPPPEPVPEKKAAIAVPALQVNTNVLQEDVEKREKRAQMLKERSEQTRLRIDEKRKQQEAKVDQDAKKLAEKERLAAARLEQQKKAAEEKRLKDRETHRLQLESEQRAKKLQEDSKGAGFNPGPANVAKLPLAALPVPANYVRSPLRSAHLHALNSSGAAVPPAAASSASRPPAAPMHAQPQPVRVPASAPVPAPAPAPAPRGSPQSYDISSLTSDQEDDDEDDSDAPVKPVPSWARGQALRTAIANQFHFKALDESCVFDAVPPPDLENIFGKRKKGNYRRGSSAVWQDSPTHPGTLKQLA